MLIYIWLCVALLTMCQIADWWTTSNVLARGGTELNPIMIQLFAIFGQAVGLVIAKFYVMAFAVYGLFFGLFNSQLGIVILTLITMLYVAVVVNNVKQYRKA